MDGYILKVIAEMVRAMVRNGVDADTIAEAVIAMEAVVPARSANAERQARYRARFNADPDCQPKPNVKEWEQLRKFIFARDNHRCRYCGGEAKEVDHVIPLSRGGSNDAANLTAACVRCNRSKGARTPEEWRGDAA